MVGLSSLSRQISINENESVAVESAVAETNLCENEEIGLIGRDEAVADRTRTDSDTAVLENGNGTVGSGDMRDTSENVRESSADGADNLSEGWSDDEEEKSIGVENDEALVLIVREKPKCLSQFFTALKKLFLDLKLFLWQVNIHMCSYMLKEFLAVILLL